MIRKLKGWQNYLVLYLAYLVLGFGLYYLFRWISGVYLSSLAHLFIVFFIFLECAIHCGMYLAKWRFYINVKTGEEDVKFD